MEKFHLIFQQLMSDEKVSKNQLYKATNIARKSIAYYLDGICFPRYDNLLKIADFFEVSTDYLLGLVGNDGLCYKTNCPIERIPNYFIAYLKQLMLSENLSQNKLADLLNVEATTVSKWFNMKTMPETPLIVKLAGIYKCRVDYLLNRDVVR